MLVKILGIIDLLSSITFLMLTFGLTPWLQLILFCAGLLFAKGLFILQGNILSGLDLFASICLILSIFFALPAILIWILALFLMGKGIVSLF